MIHGYKRELALVVNKFFDKSFSERENKNKVKLNQKLTDQQHEPIISKFKKCKVILLNG